jgi:hypothetical protein
MRATRESGLKEVGEMVGAATGHRAAVWCGLTAVTIAIGAARAGAARTIDIYVDGERVSYFSQVLNESIPALLVNDIPMVSVRFLSGYFELPLDLHLMKYGIVSVNTTSFKLGVPEALRRVPMVGGDPAQATPLPSAPRVIAGRIYVPAMPTIQAVVGTNRVAGVRWDAGRCALHISRYKYAGGGR